MTAFQSVSVVHRDVQILTALREMCTSFNLECSVYLNATEFVAANSDRIWGCMLLDVHLEYVEGMPLHEWLLNKNLVIPTIYLAESTVDAHTVVQRFRTGAIDLFIHPWGQLELFDRIQYAIQCQHSLMNLEQQTTALQERVNRLTRRQRQVFDRLMQGMTGPEIAKDLQLEPKTVDRHRSGVLRRLDVPHTAHAVRFGMELRAKLLSAEMLRQRLGFSAGSRKRPLPDVGDLSEVTRTPLSDP